MTKASEKYQSQSSGSLKMLLAMVGIGLACALFIVLTYEGTKASIEKNKAEALQRAIFMVLPGATKSTTFKLRQDHGLEQISNSTSSDTLIYSGYNNDDELVGVAIEAKGQGYADIINILYGYSPEKEEIIGFYVLASKETPGLGDKIEKDESFLENFEHLDVSMSSDYKELNNTIITVKKGSKINPWEIDGITGATISSRAIGEILSASTKDLIPSIKKHEKQLIINE